MLSACSWTVLALTCPTQLRAADPEVQSQPDEIVVIGTRLAQPERELDEQGIQSYGQSTIDALIGELQGELGDDVEPFILVNGQRVTDLDDIGSLPVEALKNVKILPRGSAVRAGGSAAQRVVDIKLKDQLRSATVLLAPKVSTDGDWHSERGEATLTYIRKDTRANLTLKAREESDLLESERDLRQPDPTLPYALGGNVIGYPNTSGEIDPLLSAAAGEVVTVAQIPGANPTLADFAAGANEAAVTDLGDFRTLRPDTGNYDLNGTFATRLAPWLKGNFGLRLSRSTRRSLRGLPQALFVLNPTNASSPFGTTVAIAEYGADPLTTRSERDSAEANLTLNGKFGRWSGFFTAKQSYATDRSRTERVSSTGAITIPDAVDPFESDLFDLVTLRTDRSRAKTVNSNAKLAFTGPLAALPAGDIQATFEGEFARNRLHSESDTFLSGQPRNVHRSQLAWRTAVDVPLTSSDGFGSAIGRLSVSADYRGVHYSDIGTVANYQLGAAWEPRPVLLLTADLERTSVPASVQLLGNPTVVTTGVRTFDPLTGETVDVTQITGGNPDLEPEKSRVHRLGAVVRPGVSGLQLTAEYTDTRERNFVSSVPEASAAVMLAFPDRFIRDGGVLTTVDLRPVNYDSHREKRFKYGFSLNRTLAGKGSTSRVASSAGIDGDDDGAPEPTIARSTTRDRRAPRTRISFTASHSIVFKDEIAIRPGLDSIDLLKGGAIGIGAGRVRHQVDASASVSQGGTGVRATVNWRGKSELEAIDLGLPDTLRFSPVFNLNLRAFADVHRFVPGSGLTRNMRLSINIQNLTNDRQEVRNSAGDTPLRYQPGYRDPLGRTIEIEIRKVF